MSTSNITYYSKKAESLTAQYNNVSFTDVHSDWIKHLPAQGWALDVGAGSGRDSIFLAHQGLSVVAVEPAKGMRELAQNKHANANIHWIDDTLPNLQKVFALHIKFDLILLSAVWMHIPPVSRERAFRKLSLLLKPNGKLVISLRHGECHDERVMYAVSTSEQSQLANKFGLTYELATRQASTDKLGRDDVSWQTVVLTLPDDGTGAFPLIRNIVVNDNKSSTYKLALLRSILRVAEGHPGAVIGQTDDHVQLPLGLVAFYWLKLYRPLIDTYDMQQNSNAKSGLGFIKKAGWNALKSVGDADLYLGARFGHSLGGDATAIALQHTLKDISRTIKDMPVKHITLPGTKQAIFSVETTLVQKQGSSIILGGDYFASFGSLYIPKHIWDAMTQFSVWIEPALLNEWVSQMQKYGDNKTKAYSRNDYYHALHWDTPKRSTSKVRSRVDELLNIEKIRCVWSSKKITKSTGYAVDHAFPFARWPNNDLWNLVPTKTQVNAKKSDKLPSATKLRTCRGDIVNWWQLAWGKDSSEFFTQAALALPSLQANNTNFDDVFEAFLLQRNRIRELQQLTEWQ